MAQWTRDLSFKNKSFNELISLYPKPSALLFLLHGFTIHCDSDETEHRGGNRETR